MTIISGYILCLFFALYSIYEHKINYLTIMYSKCDVTSD